MGHISPQTLDKCIDRILGHEVEDNLKPRSIDFILRISPNNPHGFTEAQLNESSDGQKYGKVRALLKDRLRSKVHDKPELHKKSNAWLLCRLAETLGEIDQMSYQGEICYHRGEKTKTVIQIALNEYQNFISQDFLLYVNEMNLRDPIFLEGDCQRLHFDHLPVQEGQIQQSDDPSNIETNLVAELNDGHDNVANSSLYSDQSYQQFNHHMNHNDSNVQSSLQMSYPTQDINDNNDNLVPTPIHTSSYPPIHTSFYPPSYPSSYPSSYPPSYPSFYPPFYPPSYPSFYPPFYPPSYQSFYPPFYPPSQSHQPFQSPLQTTFSLTLSPNYNFIYCSNSNLSYGNVDGTVSINPDVGNLSFNFTYGTRNQARERDRSYQG